MSLPSELANTLPHLPGVYRMISASNEVLYVGKALDLRKRVTSYFQRSDGLSPRIRLMVSQIAGLEVTITRSESEALLLENNLIKSLSPKFNILFRDDKSYPYLILTNHGFPKLAYFRGNPEKSHHFFGPFPNAGAVRESMQLLQKIFRLRTCDDGIFNHRSRPCLLHQIHRCTAPCVNFISSDEYAKDVHSAMLFLNGEDDGVFERLNRLMSEAADLLKYEDAVIYRDQISALRKVREHQYVSDVNSKDVDVIALASVGDVSCINIVMIRGGRHLGDKNIFPVNSLGMSTIEIVEAFISSHYALIATPKNIIVSEKIDVQFFESFLSENSKYPVRISTGVIGDRRAMLEMGIKNAQIAATRKHTSYVKDSDKLIRLREILNLGDSLNRIECFDISHTQGESPVASCVVYDHGEMKKNEYRKFNIHLANPGDDYAAMREALMRRYKRMILGDSKLPDLIMVDGGLGQLHIAIEVLSELSLKEIPILGVSKGVSRKPGMEQLWLAGYHDAISATADDLGLHLIQQIRDEAHRFAISGHRMLRARKRNQSPLEGIDGVGAKRRQQLLAHFGGLRDLISASIEDLATVKGISRELAERIYDVLHS